MAVGARRRLEGTPAVPGMMSCPRCSAWSATPHHLHKGLFPKSSAQSQQGLQQKDDLHKSLWPSGPQETSERVNLGAWARTWKCNLSCCNLMRENVHMHDLMWRHARACTRSTSKREGMRRPRTTMASHVHFQILKPVTPSIEVIHLQGHARWFRSRDCALSESVKLNQEVNGSWPYLIPLVMDGFKSCNCIHIDKQTRCWI